MDTPNLNHNNIIITTLKQKPQPNGNSVLNHLLQHNDGDEEEMENAVLNLIDRESFHLVLDKGTVLDMTTTVQAIGQSFYDVLHHHVQQNLMIRDDIATHANLDIWMMVNPPRPPQTGHETALYNSQWYLQMIRDFLPHYFLAHEAGRAAIEDQILEQIVNHNFNLDNPHPRYEVILDDGQRRRAIKSMLRSYCRRL